MKDKSNKLEFHNRSSQRSVLTYPTTLGWVKTLHLITWWVLFASDGLHSIKKLKAQLIKTLARRVWDDSDNDTLLQLFVLSYYIHSISFNYQEPFRGHFGAPIERKIIQKGSKVQLNASGSNLLVFWSYAQFLCYLINLIDYYAFVNVAYVNVILWSCINE